MFILQDTQLFPNNSMKIETIFGHDILAYIVKKIN